ncbi:hypothetical protein [Actinomadura geliboluensis]|uniref:hypothetical protein n=1 Tax=Actinomadura geliboluensis TaxID=882440 RepID=UPI001486EDA1|nr:hypothetical protein [Actinomadura geliboluensis]
MWLHAGTDMVATDRIEWDDHPWEVDGDPERRPDPTGGGPHHVGMTAARVTGG